MPITDKVTPTTNGSRPAPTTLTAIRSVGASSIQCGALTGWPTVGPIHFMIYRVDTQGKKVPGSQTDWKGLVVGNTITQLVPKAGTDNGDIVGATVEAGPTAGWAQELSEALLQDHDGLGHHKTLTDINGNELIEFPSTPVAGAVNQLKVTPAATAGAVRADANGDDSIVDLYLGPKGAGVAHAENSELTANFIASGGAIAVSAGLVGTFSNIVFYIRGKRYKKLSIANKTYTASKDTYIDIDVNGNITYIEVANGATTGMALTANSVRVAKVVTSGAAITLIQQYSSDPLANPVYPTAPSDNAKISLLSAMAPFIDNTSSGNFTSATVVNTNIVVPAGCNRILILGKLRCQSQVAAATDMSASIIYDNGVSATPTNPGQQTSPVPSVVTGVGTFAGAMNPFFEIFNTTPGTHNIQISCNSNNAMNVAYKELIFIPLAG